MRYVIETKVLKIEELFDRKYEGGFGNNTQFKSLSKGFFVSFEGSYEKLNLGFERPELKVGDKVKIVIERMER